MNKTRINRSMWAYGLIAPSFILICILYLCPIVQTIYYSFNQIHGYETPKWVGLQNYVTAFKDQVFWQSLLNTLLYTLVTVPIGVILSLLVAVGLNEKIHCKSLLRVVYFLPVVSAPTAIAMVWRWLYNDQYGIINYFMSFFGIKGANWIGDNNLVLWSIMIVGIWSLLGYNMIILLAGLQNVPRTFYEAAEIDGAGPVARFTRITLPLVSPTLFFVLMTTIISSLQVFDYIYMMIDTKSPALESAESVVYYFYKQTFVLYNKGFGSAIATILLLIILVITYIQMKLQHRWVNYD